MTKKLAILLLLSGLILLSEQFACEPTSIAKQDLVIQQARKIVWEEFDAHRSAITRIARDGPTDADAALVRTVFNAVRVELRYYVLRARTESGELTP